MDSVGGNSSGSVGKHKGKLSDEGALEKLNFVTKIVFLMKIVAGFSLFCLCYFYLEPMWDQSISKANVIRIKGDVKAITDAIMRHKASGKKFTGESSSDLVSLGLLQSCQDPWGQPYYISPRYDSIVSLGADCSEPVTAPAVLCADGTLLKSDNITFYHGFSRPGSVWISVEGPEYPLLFDVSLDGATAKDITDLTKEIIYKPSLSADGKKLAWLRPKTEGLSAEDDCVICVGNSSGLEGIEISETGTDFSKIEWNKTSSKIIYSFLKKGGPDRNKVVVYDLSTKKSKVYFSDMPDDDYNPVFSRTDDSFFFARQLGSESPLIKHYADGFDGPENPFGVKTEGDFPVANSRGYLFFFRGSGDNRHLYAFMDKSSGVKKYHDGFDVLPPIRLALNERSYIYTKSCDYGWVVCVRYAGRVGRKKVETFIDHPIFATPYPVRAITEQIPDAVLNDETSGDDVEPELAE